MDGMEVNLSRAIDFFYPSSSSLELVMGRQTKSTKRIAGKAVQHTENQ